MQSLESPFINAEAVRIRMHEKGWDIFYEDNEIIRFMGKGIQGRSCTVSYDKSKNIYIGFSKIITPTLEIKK